MDEHPGVRIGLGEGGSPQPPSWRGKFKVNHSLEGTVPPVRLGRPWEHPAAGEHLTWISLGWMGASAPRARASTVQNPQRKA